MNYTGMVSHNPLSIYALHTNFSKATCANGHFEFFLQIWCWPTAWTYAVHFSFLCSSHLFRSEILQGK